MSGKARRDMGVQGYAPAFTYPLLAKAMTSRTASLTSTLPGGPAPSCWGVHPVHDRSPAHRFGVLDDSAEGRASLSRAGGSVATLSGALAINRRFRRAGRISPDSLSSLRRMLGKAITSRCSRTRSVRDYWLRFIVCFVVAEHAAR